MLSLNTVSGLDAATHMLDAILGGILGQRPLGVTVIGILCAISGTILLLGGLGTLAVAGLPFANAAAPGAVATPSVMFSPGAFLAVAAMMGLPVGAAFLGIAFGIFTGKQWAWTGAFALAIVGLVFSVVLMAGAGQDRATLIGYTASMGISGIVLGYLYTAEVKEFFGKPVPPQPGAEAEKEKEATAASAEAGESPSSSEEISEA